MCVCVEHCATRSVQPALFATHPPHMQDIAHVEVVCNARRRASVQIFDDGRWLNTDMHMAIALRALAIIVTCVLDVAKSLHRKLIVAMGPSVLALLGLNRGPPHEHVRRERLRTKRNATKN